MKQIRRRVLRKTKTIHGWPNILKSGNSWTPQQKRQLTKKRRG